MRNYFNQQLISLKKDIIKMSVNCESILRKCFKPLENKQESMIKLANEIEHQNIYIENLCLRLLLLQQPVAYDQRVISVALKVVYHLKRIGEQSLHIYEYLNEDIDKNSIGDLDKLIKKTQEIVAIGLHSYYSQDQVKAEIAIEMDSVVDDLFLKVKDEIINRLKQTPEEIEMYANYLIIAKYLERIADHAIDIAELVSYQIYG